MKLKLLCCLTALLAAMTIQSQTTVTTHWALDKTIKDLTPGSAAYNTATASTITYEGTDVSKMLETSVTFGANLAFQATITPQSYVTKETGLQILRFKTQGAADGSDNYAMTLQQKPTGDLTYVPTKVSLSVASWLTDGKDAFQVLLYKLNANGEISQTYPLGTVKSHTDVNAQYDDVSFDVPTTATASNDPWQVVVRMANGYGNGKNLAMGNVTLIGTATLGGMVQTSTFTATVSPEGAGTVSPATTSVVTGDNVTCTATANIGYAFGGWYQGETLVASNNPHTFSITANTQVEARFTKLPEATLTYGVADASAGMGTVSVSEQGDNGRYNAGTTLTLTANANQGHYFVRWEDGAGNVVSTNAQYTFTLNEDRTLKAVFAMIDNYKADLIAFPGAEGFGRFTTGGRMIDSRGAKVYCVTRLDDSNAEGTFRWAVTTGDDTPRTVVFRVAGTIYLKENVNVKSNTTIAGQTAPGGGICLAGYRVKLGSNIIIRHIRFRAGDLPNSSMSPLGVENVQNVVLDHCSFSWSMEENLTLYDNKFTTTQWCIFSEGLYCSKNVKGVRAYGAQWGGERSTMHHCLFAHNNSRSPRFNGVRTENHDRQVINEFTNNVIFNWGSANAIYGGENYINSTGIDPEGTEPHYNRTYMINNYYRPGPATKSATESKRYWCSASGNDVNMVGQWYLSGNKFELSSQYAPSTTIWSNTELQKVNQDNLYGFLSNNASRAMNFWSLSPSQTLYNKALLTSIVDELPYTNYESADAAYQNVTTKAGASLPRYDEVDTRILAEAAGTQDVQFQGQQIPYTDKNGDSQVATPAMGIINTPADIALSRYDEFYALDEATGQTIKTQMWPWLGMDDGEQLMQDTDLDGMPDAYEAMAGLNPRNAADACLLTSSGYSNLEVFLNGVADGDIDIQQYKFPSPVEKRQLFNAIVDPTDVSAYQTIQAAVNDAEQKATEDSPYYIFVKAGTYNEHVEITKPYIHITGQSRHQVIITDNKPKSYNGNIGKTATVYVNASDVTLDNLTISNTYGSGEQALALYTLGDRISVTQCRLKGWQDTYRTGKSGQRHLVRECRISGTTDFIYNAGDVFFDRDTLELTNTTNVIVAPAHINPTWGYVFRDAYIMTSVKSANVTTDLGRPWGDTPMVSFIDTRLHDNVSITAAGWRDMDGLPIQMAEYNTTDAMGQAVDLSQRKTQFKAGSTTVTSKAVLTEAEASTYTLHNVLSGSDQWDADLQGRILPAPLLTVNNGNISWSDATGQAVCYLVITNGQATLTTSETMAYDGSNDVTVQAVSTSGILGRAVSAFETTAMPAVTKAKTGATTYYDLLGRQHDQPRKGINLVKGKKYMK